MIKLYKTVPMSIPRSAVKPHQIHLQHHLLPYTAYTIIAKHKYIYHTNTPKEFLPLIPYHMATTMLFVFYVFL